MPQPALLDLVENVLRGALALTDASLVIFRHGVLVEFKTEMLKPALMASIEQGRRAWQVGPFEGHHCHLDLASVGRVWFDAEPVSCQGGRLNYTVWFLASGDCGNPYRPNGLFSITLNAPYTADGAPDGAVIAPVYALHDLFADRSGISASDGFAAARRSWTLEAEVAQRRMIVGPSAERPEDLAAGSQDGRVIDAGVTVAHQAVAVEFPVLAAVAAKP